MTSQKTAAEYRDIYRKFHADTLRAYLRERVGDAAAANRGGKKQLVHALWQVHRVAPDHARLRELDEAKKAARVARYNAARAALVATTRVGDVGTVHQRRSMGGWGIVRSSWEGVVTAINPERGLIAVGEICKGKDQVRRSCRFCAKGYLGRWDGVGVIGETWFAREQSQGAGEDR